MPAEPSVEPKQHPPGLVRAEGPLRRRRRWQPQFTATAAVAHVYPALSGSGDASADAVHGRLGQHRRESGASTTRRRNDAAVAVVAAASGVLASSRVLEAGEVCASSAAVVVASSRPDAGSTLRPRFFWSSIHWEARPLVMARVVVDTATATRSCSTLGSVLHQQQRRDLLVATIDAGEAI